MVRQETNAGAARIELDRPQALNALNAELVDGLLRALPKPIVCAVNGVAAGIGISLALAGDLVVAAESASFNFAFTRVGVVPDGGAMFFMQNAIGRPRAQREATLQAEASRSEYFAEGRTAFLEKRQPEFRGC
jgi:enoyl-CoA hydratase